MALPIADQARGNDVSSLIRPTVALGYKVLGRRSV
jgi:hypothetical protein